MTERLIQPRLDRSLADRAYDFLGDILLQAETEELLQEIEADKASGNTADMDEFFVHQDQRHLKQIQQYFRKKRYKQLLSSTLPKIVQAAAIFIAIVTLAGGVAIATSHTVRVHVMKLLYQMEEEYTAISIVEDEEASFDVPAEWQGTSYMSFIPDEYELYQIISYSDYNRAEYGVAGTNKVTLKFSEFGMNIESNVDTENAKISQVDINGYTGILAIKENDCSVFWCDGRQYYLLSVRNSSSDELLTIAKGVEKIN